MGRCEGEETVGGAQDGLARMSVRLPSATVAAVSWAGLRAHGVVATIAFPCIFLCVARISTVADGLSHPIYRCGGSVGMA